MATSTLLLVMEVNFSEISHSKGSGGDPNNYAQNTLTMLGKLLRIDIDGRTGID